MENLSKNIHVVSKTDNRRTKSETSKKSKQYTFNCVIILWTSQSCSSRFLETKPRFISEWSISSRDSCFFNSRSIASILSSRDKQSADLTGGIYLKINTFVNDWLIYWILGINFSTYFWEQFMPSVIESQLCLDFFSRYKLWNNWKTTK